MTLEELPVIIELRGRQQGLDNQIQVPGEYVKVYDGRARICFLDFTGRVSSFVDESDPRKLYRGVLMEDYIVSACFDKGIFTYDTMAGTDSDPQYIGIEVPKERVEETISHIGGLRGVKDIIFGKRISNEKLLPYIKNLRDRYISEQVRGFYQLNRRKQREFLRELLLPNWRKRLK